MIAVSVARTFPGFSLDVAFAAPDSGVTALFGASGAGKTSVVNMIAGLVRPERGRIDVAGRVLFDSEARVALRPEHRGIGYVFQEDRLFPHLSVRRNLRYGMRRRGGAAAAHPSFGDVVALLGIGHLLGRLPHLLSGGEKQRVAIGRALLSRPSLLLMDEPLASLDAARRAEILPFLERLRIALAIPIVYVSHALDEITQLADTLVVLEEGRVVACGPVAEITARVDLAPVLDQRDAGTVLDATVESHDARYGLTALATAGGRLVVPGLDAPPGTRLRLRLQARDIALAIDPPRAISTLNVLRGTVEALGPQRHAHRDVRIDVGMPIVARITQRSVEELGIAPGRAVSALIKSVAVERRG